MLKRLIDTSLFLFDVVLDGPASLLPGGRGFECCLEVRALHGSVRRRVRARDEAWDAETLGVPVNQEDMAVTLLAFSYNVLVGVEFLKGRRLSRAEEEDYLHLWRYLGHLLGVEDRYNPCLSYAHAKATLESIVLHILEPDDDSRRLARSMLAAPSGGDDSGRAFVTRAELCRSMIGDDLADALGLPRPPPSRLVALLRLYLRTVGTLLDVPVLGTCLQIAHGLQMRAVRVLHAKLRRGPKRHAVQATVDAPVSTCPYSQRRGTACPARRE